MKIRVITLLTALALIFSGAGTAAFEDIEGAPCEEAVKVLSAIGILGGKSDNEFAPEDTLTRAEMTAIILRLMGAGSLSGEDVFEDVDSSHWAYADISTAYRMGIVSGTGEETFEPDKPITYAQAVKMTVCALGYDVYAQSMGGYPGGYLTKATQLGLLKGAPAQGEEITRGTAAIILYNTLDVDILVKDGYGDASGYVEKKGATVLSEYLNIGKYSGVITANYYTTTDGLRAVRKGNIRLGGTEYSAGDSGAEALVGCEAVIYADISTEQVIPLIKAAVVKPLVSITVIDADDISQSTTERSMCYETSGIMRRLEIRSGAALVYNGSAVSGWTKDDLIPEYGTVTLISSDGVSAGIIFVEDYENFVVSSVNPDEKMIYLKNSSPILIDLENRSMRMEFMNADGSEAEIGDCVKEDILSVAASRDGAYYKVVRCDDTVEGIVREAGADRLVIDDEEYKLAKGFSQMPKAGDAISYTLDFRGRIMSPDTSFAGDMTYGYLVSAMLTKGVEQNPLLKIFTEDGEMKTFSTLNTITVSGVGISAKNLLNDGVGIAEGGNVKRQLVRFKTDEDGEKITHLNVEGTGEDNVRRDLYIDENRRIEGDPNPIYFIGNTLGMFAGKYLVRSETKTFIIPAAGAADKNYKIKAYNTFSHGTDGEAYTKISLYDTDKNRVISAIVWEVDTAGDSDLTYPGYTETAAIITDITDGISEDGEIVKNLKLYTWAGKEDVITALNDFEVLFKVSNTNLDTDPEVVNRVRKNVVPLSSLRPGDVVQYSTTLSGEATMINVLFRGETPGEREMVSSNGNITYTLPNVNYRGGLLCAYGVVKEVGDYGVLTEVNQGSSSGNGLAGAVFDRVYVFSGQMLSYDMKERELTKITSQDIYEGDNVLSIWRTNTQMMLIVYKR